MGRELVVKCYGLSDLLPEVERFGLVSQIRRAALSIPANIAEGTGRKTDGSFVSFLRIALGSAFELDTLLTLCHDLGLLLPSDVEPVQADIKRLSIKIQNLIKSLNVQRIREEAADYPTTTERPLSDHLATT